MAVETRVGFLGVLEEHFHLLMQVEILLDFHHFMVKQHLIHHLPQHIAKEMIMSPAMILPQLFQHEPHALLVVLKHHFRQPLFAQAELQQH